MWQLQALGHPTLRGEQRSLTPERKSAAILTYLALEGPTPRSRLAGLLWPESLEETARNNLAQNLRRLRQNTGATLITGEDALQLSPAVTVDAAELKVHAFSGEMEKVIAHVGTLLGGFDYDDCPEFSDWLYSEREKLGQLQEEARVALIEAHQSAGRYLEAIKHAEELIDLNPISESAYRTLMQLHYLQGDRPAALKVYHRCQEALRRELNVEPLPETKELARKIDQGESQVPATPRRNARTLPPFILRPPVLVGREEAWATMDEAWAQGKTIYLTGEPGIGKTRLAQEFVTSKGRGLYLPAPPGQQDVPFAAALSLARTRIAEAPGATLPDWVQRELSRILPEFQQGDDPLPPMQGEEDRLRFFQAYFEMVKLTGEGFIATISDDTQYYDQATVELGGFMMSQQRAALQRGILKTIPRYVVIYRRDELPAAVQAILDRQVAAEMAVRINLDPLDTERTSTLLASLQLEGLGDEASSAFSSTVHHRTGGNVLFILETLRNLIETGSLSGPPPSQLPLTSKVDGIIRQRVARLSPQAQRVVQVAAVLESEFDLELIASVLGLEPMSLIPEWEELERAQIFSGNRFSHDLLYESVLGAISQPVKALLHQRCAEVLARQRGTFPARIAKHWLAAGREGEAAPYLHQAANRAVAEARLNDAEKLFEQAIQIYHRHARPEALAAVMEDREQLAVM